MVQHILHHLVGEELGRLALTGDLHDLKGKLRFQPLVEQIGHNAVTSTDYFGNGTGFVIDQVFRVSEPNVSAVGQAGNLQKVSKGLGLGLLQHAADERRTHLRQGEGPGIAENLVRSNAQRLGGGKEADDLFVGHGNLHHLDAGQILDVLIKGRNIVPQLVQL